MRMATPSSKVQTWNAGSDISTPLPAPVPLKVRRTRTRSPLTMYSCGSAC